MMRYTILAAAFAGALVTGSLHTASAKAPKADVGTGRIAWFDLTTPNIAQSKEFYGKLFGWQFTSLESTNLAVEITAGGTAIGTLRVAEGKIAPYNGVVYVQVQDIQESCKKAKELGGTVPPGFPFNLSGNGGAIALVVDPAGHPVGMYARTPLPPSAPPAK